MNTAELRKKQKFLQAMHKYWLPSDVVALRKAMVDGLEETVYLSLIEDPVIQWMIEGVEVIRAHKTIPIVNRKTGMVQFGVDWFFSGGGRLGLRSFHGEVVYRIQPTVLSAKVPHYPRRVMREVLSVLHDYKEYTRFHDIVPRIFASGQDESHTVSGCLAQLKSKELVQEKKLEIPSGGIRTHWRITELGVLVYAGLCALRRPGSGTTETALERTDSPSLTAGLKYLLSLEAPFKEARGAVQKASRPLDEYVSHLLGEDD